MSTSLILDAGYPRADAEGLRRLAGVDPALEDLGSGGGGNLVFNRFTGPGRVGLQSAYYHPPAASGGSQSGADRVGNFIGEMLKG